MMAVTMRQRKPDLVPGFFCAPQPKIWVFRDTFPVCGANYTVKAELSMVQNSQ